MSRSYWKERERQKQARMDKVTDEQLKRFRELLLASLDDLDKQIQKIYMKYAKDNNLDYHDALQYLTDDEKKEFQKDLQYYLEKAQNEQDRIQYKQELHALSVRHRVKRIEMLKANIQKHASILHNRLNTETREAISSLYPEGFLRGIYESVQGKDPDGVPLAEAINPSYVQEILETPWSGKNYSEKIWDLTSDFEKKLSETLTQGLVQGKHPNEMARDFRKLGVGKEGTGGIVHRAETLMQTEAANIIEQATLKGYAATKIDEYEFMTAKDGKVCGICADINKERFPCDKAITGTNYPPMHPRCRCTTVPVTPYSNEDPNEQYVYETDYDEWYETYCAESVDDAYAQWAKENGVDLEDELNVRAVEKKKTISSEKYTGLVQTEKNKPSTDDVSKHSESKSEKSNLKNKRIFPDIVNEFDVEQVSDENVQKVKLALSELGKQYTEEEKEHLTDMTRGTSQSINNKISNGRITQKEIDKMKILDKALSKGKITEDIVLYRTTDIRLMKDVFPFKKITEENVKSLIGKTAVNTIYTSTTFTPFEWGGRNCDIVLKVKKGTKNVAYMRPLAVEQFEYQDEILFGRGLKYQIQDARIKEGRVLILAEVINDE